MLCADPLWGPEEPIPQLLNLLSADGWQMDPSPSIAHSWRTLPCPRSRPLPSALETSDWLMEGYKGQTPPPPPHFLQFESSLKGNPSSRTFCKISWEWWLPSPSIQSWLPHFPTDVSPRSPPQSTSTRNSPSQDLFAGIPLQETKLPLCH